MDGYNRGSHSKHSLKVHLIFVTKYRKKLFLHPDMKEDIKQSLYEAAQKEKSQILQMETDKDHVHLLVGYPPMISISHLVKTLKQKSTYETWQRHGALLKKTYWQKSIFWSDGYFACSVGQASQLTIEKYIKNQG